MAVNNSVQIDDSSGTTTVAFPALAMSAAGNNRQLVILCLNKYNTGASTVSAISCTGTGVNATIANGQVVEIGVQQVAGGTFASVCAAYHVADANLATLAENLTISTTTVAAAQHSQWIAFEMTGYDFALDAFFDAIEINSTPANTNMTESVTTTVANCLVINAFAASHGGTDPIRAANQTLIEFVPNALGSGMSSWIVKATAGSQGMTENLSQATARYATKVLSFSPATVNQSYQITGDITYPINISATFSYSVAPINYQITGDIPYTFSMTAGMLYTPAGASAYSITGDIPYTFGIAAGMQYAVAPTNNLIIADITYLISISASSMVYSSAINNSSIQGDITYLVNISASSMAFNPVTNNYSITGDISYPIGITAGMVYGASAAVISNPVALPTGSTTSTGSFDTTKLGGIVYWVESSVVTQPTGAQIKAGQDGTGNVPSNNAPVPATGTISGLNTGGLTASTTYFRHYIQDNGQDSNIITAASYTTNVAPTGLNEIQSVTTFIFD